MLVFQLCSGLGASRFTAHTLAFGAGLAALYSALRLAAGAETARWKAVPGSAVLLAVFLVWLFRIGFFVAIEASLPPLLPILPSIAAGLASATAASWLLCSRLPPGQPVPVSSDARFRLRLAGVILISLALRLLFAGSFELLKEEAYYWAYAQHLDIGYLDHPPMVAVLIKLGTLLLGDSELAVRIGALFCWVLAAYFAWCYAAEAGGRNQDLGLQAAAIMSVIPGFFTFGLFMTPDAPLIACWAGTIFFLRRALVDLDKKSWIGVGLFLGLGLFSKYTIALLGPAIVIFMIIDRPSRHLLIRPSPYAAALLAVLVFSPVIIWNMQHEWASFLFQTQNRLEATSEFSTHEMLLFILILLSPVGFAGALCFLFGRRKYIGSGEISNRTYLFGLTMTVVPLLTLLFVSLNKEVKFNWTAPIWLAALPFMAMILSPTSTILSERVRSGFVRSWKITFVVLLIAYGTLFQFFSIGIPGVAYRGGGPLWGWGAYAEKLDKLADLLEEQTTLRPLIVGMDQYKTASGLAFYRTVDHNRSSASGSDHPLGETVGRNIVGKRSAVMYDYWFSPSDYQGRPMILVSPSRSNLNDMWITRNIDHVGEIQILETTRNGAPAAPLYYRLSHDSHQGPDRFTRAPSTSAPHTSARADF
jgi:dolichol-phosphate mannosyltransferase